MESTVVCGHGHMHVTKLAALHCKGDVGAVGREHKISLDKKTGGGWGGHGRVVVYTPRCACGYGGGNYSKREAEKTARDHQRMTVPCPKCSVPAGEWCHSAEHLHKARNVDCLHEKTTPCGGSANWSRCDECHATVDARGRAI